MADHKGSISKLIPDCHISGLEKFKFLAPISIILQVESLFFSRDRRANGPRMFTALTSPPIIYDAFVPLPVLTLVPRSAGYRLI